jgi:hypothetical protein
MAAGIFEFNVLVISSLLQFCYVRVVPKYLNVDTFSKEIFAISLHMRILAQVSVKRIVINLTSFVDYHTQLKSFSPD